MRFDASMTTAFLWKAGRSMAKKCSGTPACIRKVPLRRRRCLRLSRYRSARVGVDVNLQTGRWSFEEAVDYFMEAGGLDREAAEGEAAGAASEPTQKIWYITGKWQIMKLLGRYRDKKGADFRLGQFHDDLLKNGSLPLSVVEWILLDDPSTLEQVLK